MIGLLIIIVLGTVIGTVLGTITGLIPGLHVNSVALIFISSTSLLLGLLSLFGQLRDHEGLLVIACMLVGTSITHTFVDFIPSTFLGLPDDETALSVLPAHKLLKEGRGYQAVHLSAFGSLLAVIYGIITLLPFCFILGPPLELYPVLKANTLFLLFFLASLMFATETSEIRGSRTLAVVISILLFLTSGLLGVLVMELPSTSPLHLNSTNLFPLFSGLFGLSTLVISLMDASDDGIPAQVVQYTDEKDCYLKPALKGSAAGSLVGFLPGVSSAHASLVAMVSIKGSRRSKRRRSEGIVRPDPNESVIVTIGAVNTSNAFFVLIALFLTGRARSGAASGLEELIPVDPWNGPVPYFLAILLFSLLLSSFLAFHITLLLGRKAAERIGELSYRKLIIGVMSFVVIMVIIFNGPLGILILVTACCLGILPPTVGVRRSHLMGVLLVPVILYYW